MMKYEIRGNYLFNEFRLPPTKGPDSAEKSISKHSPADHSDHLWVCPIDYRHINDLIESSVQGFETWRKTDLNDRMSFISKFHENLISKIDQISEALSLETGRPIWNTTDELRSVIESTHKTLTQASNILDTKIYPQHKIGFRPVGPTLVIGTYAHPLIYANEFIINSLLAGNSVIFKPSEEVCYSSQLYMECMSEANPPLGIINLAQGDGEVASRLLREKSIKAIFFTGTTDTGKEILSATHNDLQKILCMNMSSKNATILHEDCDIESSIHTLLQSCFYSSGQRCDSTSIVPIHKSIHQEVIEKFHNLAKRIIVDHPIKHDKSPYMGPLINQASMDSYLLLIGMAKREGFEEVMRGKHIENKHNGLYAAPSVHLAETFNISSHFLTNEVFGPNCTFITYDKIEEAIQMVNELEYGLVTSIYSKKSELLDLCLNEINTGIININRPTIYINREVPILGQKKSGNNRVMGNKTIFSCTTPIVSNYLEKQEDLSNDYLGIDDKSN